MNLLLCPFLLQMCSTSWSGRRGRSASRLRTAQFKKSATTTTTNNNNNNYNNNNNANNDDNHRSDNSPVCERDANPSTAGEKIRAMKEVLEKIGVPEVIYHDNEGSWSSTEFIRLLNSHKIKHIITSTPPPFAERLGARWAKNTRSWPQ